MDRESHQYLNVTHREAEQLCCTRDIQPCRQMSCRLCGQYRLRQGVSHILVFGLSCQPGPFALVLLFLEAVRV